MIPKTAVGLRLNPSISQSLNFQGADEYSDKPLSPVRFINTSPVLLWFLIRSDATSICFMLRIFDRQDAVRGIENSFFLISPRSFQNLSMVFFQTETF